MSSDDDDSFLIEEKEHAILEHPHPAFPEKYERTVSQQSGWKVIKQTSLYLSDVVSKHFSPPFTLLHRRNSATTVTAEVTSYHNLKTVHLAVR